MTALNPASATADVTTEVSPGTTVSVSPTESVPVRDRLTVRIVVIALAVYALAVLVSTVVLVLQDKRLPEAMETTGAVALGGLGTMLVSTSSVKT